MKERELISWKVVDIIGKYTIIKIKERMVDANERPYGPILTRYDICIKGARKWAKEN